MTIQEIVDLFPNYQLAWLEAVKLLNEKSLEYADALTGYSMTFKQQKEDGYKKTIAESEHEAGEMTGYAHKRIEVEIQAIQELIKFISYNVQGNPLSYHSSIPIQPELSTISESSASQESEQKPK